MPELLQEKVLGPLGLTNTADLGRPPRSPSRRCTPSPPSAAQPRTSQRHTVLRGVDLLEPVVDDHPRRHPDDEHLRHERHRGGASDRASCCRRSRTSRWCRPTCAARRTPCPAAPPASSRTTGYTYGLGIVISGDWLLQNPLFAGEAGAIGLPACQEDRHRRRRHLPARGVRRAGQLLQRGRHAVPQDRHGTRPRRRTADPPPK